MHVLCPHCRNPIELVRLTPREEVSCPSCGSSFHLETVGPTTPHVGAGQKLGKFQLIEVVGHGAFGTVYKARDGELDRVVALKVPRAGNLVGQQEVDRFLREARAVAQLRHPSIVTVHDVVQSDGLPCLVSDFAEGVTLTDLLSARRPGFREAAELIAGIADALQYAHERGVVHRDVKPSNLMVGPDGRPVVMDFGLAKRDAGEITMTVEGQVLGTPAYMPPEQARGEGHSVDGRGDVYSLGVVLYQLLTGELPFRGTARMLLHQVLHDEPRPPGSLNDRIPRDLQTVCLKAMAKEPARRYQTAAELAADLRRWLGGEPIQARRVGRLARAARWARRRPVAASLAAVSALAALALVGLAVGGVYQLRLSAAYAQEAEAREKAELAQQGEARERKRAEDALELADEVSYRHGVSLAAKALEEGQVAVASQRLEECKPALRNWEWRYLNAQCQPELLKLPGYHPSFSPDGSRIACGSSWMGTDGVVGIYDAWTGEEVMRLTAPGGLRSAAFSPDGLHIACNPPLLGAGTVRVFDARTGKETLRMTAPGLVFAAFSPDGSRIACVSSSLPLQGASSIGDGSVRIYHARSGEEVLRLTDPGGLGSAAFSPDGFRIACAPALYSVGKERLVFVYDARTGKEALRLTTPTRPDHPAFTPDGRRIVCPMRDGLRFYDARTGKEVSHVAGPVRADGGAALNDPAFSPDGARLACHARDGAVRVFDTRTGKESLRLTAPGGLSVAAFSPDGLRIACASVDGAVRIYDARGGKESLRLTPPGGAYSPAFSPDGFQVACGARDGVVRIRDARTGEERLRLTAPTELYSLAFNHDGSRLASRTGDGTVRIFDARTGNEVLQVAVPGRGGRPCYSPDGVHVVCPSSDGARIFDARTGKESLRLIAAGGLESATFSRDGSRVLGFSSDFVVYVFDARTGKEALRLTVPGGLRFAAFSPDGLRIACGSGDGLRIYDARTGKESLRLTGAGGAYAPAFSLDGSRIVCAYLNTLLVFDARTGTELLRLNVPGGYDPPAFSPDGCRIACASPEGLRIVDAPHDVAAWRAERSKALTDGRADWHRSQAQDAEDARDWFAAAFHLDRLMAASPAPPGDLYARRGRALAAAGHAARGRADFAAALARGVRGDLVATHAAAAGLIDDADRLLLDALGKPGDHARAWYYLGVIRLARGKPQGHVRACEALLQIPAARRGVVQPAYVVRFCTMTPDAVADWRPVVELARAEMKKTPRSPFLWYLMGLALFRAGEHQEAEELFTRAAPAMTGTDAELPLQLILAMVRHSLGKTEEASRQLREAVAAADNKAPADWVDHLTLRLFRREAERRIYGKMTPAE